MICFLHCFVLFILLLSLGSLFLNSHIFIIVICYRRPNHHQQNKGSIKNWIFLPCQTFTCCPYHIDITCLPITHLHISLSFLSFHLSFPYLHCPHHYQVSNSFIFLQDSVKRLLHNPHTSSSLTSQGPIQETT